MFWVLVIWLAISVLLLIYNPGHSVGERVLFGLLWPLLLVIVVGIWIAIGLSELVELIDRRW